MYEIGKNKNNFSNKLITIAIIIIMGIPFRYYSTSIPLIKFETAY